MDSFAGSRCDAGERDAGIEVGGPATVATPALVTGNGRAQLTQRERDTATSITKSAGLSLAEATHEV